MGQRDGGSGRARVSPSADYIILHGRVEPPSRVSVPERSASRLSTFRGSLRSLSTTLQRHQLGVFVKTVAATDGDVHQTGSPVEKTQPQEIEFDETKRR